MDTEVDIAARSEKRYLGVVIKYTGAIGLVVATIAIGMAAPARADVVPRDGTYAGFDVRSGAMGLFVMRNQIVAGVEYQIPITCENEEGARTSDFFKGGGEFPANNRLNSGLTLRNNYMENDEGLSGRELGVLVTISFRGSRPTMEVRANRGGDRPCDGMATIRLTRGPLPTGNRCTFNNTRRTFTCDRAIAGIPSSGASMTALGPGQEGIG